MSKSNIKRAPQTPSRKVEQPSYRSFSTPAQIQAYTEARFDRLKYADGAVDDLEVTEPGLCVRPAGCLDLQSESAVSWGGFLEEPPTRALVERRMNRLREGE